MCLTERKRTSPETSDPRRIIAVVSLGLSLPGAESPADFWRNILECKRFFTKADLRDWGADPACFYQPGPPALDKVYNLNGAFNYNRLVDIDQARLPDSFDFRSADGSLAFWLRAGHQAAEAAVLTALDPDRVGVIAGHVILPTTAMAEAAAALYGGQAAKNWPQPPQFGQPPQNAFKLLGYSARLLAQTLGFRGPAFTLDAACASSLYAVHLAIEELLAERLDAVITGGVAKADALFTQMGFSQLRALAPSGALSPFDHRADGLIVGEGAAALVLKRLDTALADGDRIRALIRGVGLSNDQAGNLLAPQADGQLRAMKIAWDKCGLSPARLGLIEAHGTGTPLGDQVETASLKKFLAEHPPDPVPVLTSVKGSIGHLLSAAGAAALIKTILALEHKILPPTAGFEREAPGLNLAAVPALRVLRQPEPWAEPKDGRPRLAAVNAFGFGGVNAQVVVEEWRAKDWNAPAPVAAHHRPRPAAAPLKARLLGAQALLAPWPDFASLAQNWMEAEGPPIIADRRFGALKATGLFFKELILEGASFHLPPKDLGHILPQQAMALKVTHEALKEARLSLDRDKRDIVGQEHQPGARGVDKARIGVFMGVDVDPRSADYAYRWLAPLRAAEALVETGDLPRDRLENFVQALRNKTHPALNASRVVGALGSLVASRVARYLGAGGPSYTVSEGPLSGLRALKLALEALARGEIDLALVGLVDTMGDPKTAALKPDRLWEDGAAMLVLATDQAAETLNRGQAPSLAWPEKIEGRAGALGGLLPLVKSAFFLKHRLISRGLGAGTAYWLKNHEDPPRQLSGPGFVLTEVGAEEVTSPQYSYENAAWFLVYSESREETDSQLAHLAELAEREASSYHLEGLGPSRSEKWALRRLADRFWLESPRDARPTMAILAKSFKELAILARRARNQLDGGGRVSVPDPKARILHVHDQSLLKGDLAWVFPGAGGQYHGLAHRLAMFFPHLMGRLEDETTHLAEIFPSAIFWAQTPREYGPLEAIRGQIVFGMLGANILKSFSINPQAIIGYSLGETTALLAAGIWRDGESLYREFRNEDLFIHKLSGELTAAREYWRWPEKASGPHWLAGVLTRSAEQIRTAISQLPVHLRNRVFLLVVNTPEEGLIGGEEGAVRALVEYMAAPFFPLEGVISVHNPIARLVEEEYRRFHTREIEPPRVQGRFYSFAWGRSFSLDARSVADSLTEQAVKEQNFVTLVNQAYEDGVRVFVEVGPGAGVSRLIRNILKDRPHLAVSLAPSAYEEGWSGLSRLIVELWLAGFPVETAKLFPMAEHSRMTLPVVIPMDLPAELWPEPWEIMAELKALNTAPLTAPSHLKAPEGPQSSFGIPAWSAPTRRWAAADRLETATSRVDEKFDAWRTANLPRAELSTDRPVLTREQCLEFAVGRAAPVLGPRFAALDTLPSRVRLPDAPLMFVDRVLTLKGEPLTMGPGRIVTEHDVCSEAWYLDNGHMPAGLTIEAGQADLLLSAWLGVDLATNGRAYYRLLDAEVTFHRELPKAGETATYHIKINRFFRHINTHLFRFEFEGRVGAQPLLTMTGGCAGFFTPQELAAGRGLAAGPINQDEPEVLARPELLDIFPERVASLGPEELAALRNGRLDGLIPGLTLPKPLTIPGGRLALIDRVIHMERSGGRYGLGFIRAEADVDPRAWYLVSHFVGDEVMPGTLMYEGCLSTFRVFLLSLGWVGLTGEVDWQPPLGLAASLKCRGQVTAATKTVAYEVHIHRLDLVAPVPGREPEPVAVAEAVMLADNRPIVEVRNLGLRLMGASLSGLLKGNGRFSPAAASARKVKFFGTDGPPEPTAKKSEASGSVEGLRTFSKNRLLALAVGLPSKALGPGYARFDDGAFVARLPGPPYDFLDEVAILSGRPYAVEAGSRVAASYTAPTELSPAYSVFQRVGGYDPVLPYAALNEVALQPCGFLAAYMGSALDSPKPLHFRNLGGEAQILGTVTPGQTVHTEATLIKSSSSGGMIIQHYEFICRVLDEVVYKGRTYFGFFPPEGLKRQVGLPDLKMPPKESWFRLLKPYPRGPLWPAGRWRMLDRVVIKKEASGLGQALGWVKIDPKSWFFKAHFFQDPVWPGSLGLEAFLQTAKVLALAKFAPNGPDRPWRWLAPAPAARSHQWEYRGQVIPSHKEVVVFLAVTEIDPSRQLLIFDGSLAVDGVPIYKIKDFSLQVDLPAERSRLQAAPAALNYSPEDLSSGDLKILRRRKKLNQQRLAALAGIPVTTLALLEQGKKKMDPDLGRRLLALLQAPPDRDLEKEERIDEPSLTPELLLELRCQAGLTQKDLAEKIGVTASYISTLERNWNTIKPDLARKIRLALAKSTKKL